MTIPLSSWHDMVTFDNDGRSVLVRQASLVEPFNDGSSKPVSQHENDWQTVF